MFRYSDGHAYCFSCASYFPPDKKTEDFLINEFTYEYLPWRGVDKETMRFYDVKTKVDATGKPVAIGFKYPNESYKIRDLTKDKSKEDVFSSTGDIGKSGLFGRDKFAAGSHKYVVITEGELDALSFHQVVRCPVVSVRSASSALMDCTRDRSWLASFERVYLAFDGDGAGDNACSRVAKLFEYNKVYHAKLQSAGRKDANDYVRTGEAAELRAIFSNAKRYQPESILSALTAFNKELRGKTNLGVPFPWPTLTDMTLGIRTGETYLLTAPTGVGKTEICHAIEHKVLKATDWNIAAVHIEEPERRTLQALAGIELRCGVHLPGSNYSDDEVFGALSSLVQKDDRLHLYRHFGHDDPDSIIDTFRYLVAGCSCKLAVLDHASMVVAGLRGREATTGLDYLSTRLEMLVKELDFALILVSHVNNEGMTKHSSNIAQVADTWIHADRDVTHPDEESRRITQLTVSKNRNGWMTGPAGNLLFDPLTYTLEETTKKPKPRPANDNWETPDDGFAQYTRSVA